MLIFLQKILLSRGDEGHSMSPQVEQVAFKSQRISHSCVVFLSPLSSHYPFPTPYSLLSGFTNQFWVDRVLGLMGILMTNSAPSPNLELQVISP